MHHLSGAGLYRRTASASPETAAAICCGLLAAMSRCFLISASVMRFKSFTTGSQRHRKYQASHEHHEQAARVVSLRLCGKSLYLTSTFCIHCAIVPRPEHLFAERMMRSGGTCFSLNSH